MSKVTRPEKPVLLGQHTRKQFRERMQSGELKVCIIPVAATEQHLEHLAMEHDWRSVMHVAMGAAEKNSPHVLVAPSMNIGISEHHMKHIGTLSAMPGSWLGVLFDTIRSMHSAGFEHILVLNGHGGNMAPCKGIWGQFQQRLEINLQFHSYWDLLPEKIWRDAMQSNDYPGHAQEFETAFAMYAFPENVDHEAMASQIDQSPALATPETGKILVEGIIDHVAAHVKEMVDGKNNWEVPPFFP
ncbi:MAG: creatininase family protein [Planctomycetaceae bacterium]|nr:creatininase family protein [Planctomycetaceae bacterium]